MILDAEGKPVAGTELTEEQTVQLLAAEIEACDTPLILGPIPPIDALHLAGLLQLATRHAGVSATHRAVAAAVVDAIRGYFEERPTVLTILDRGDDPSQDVPSHDS